MLRFICLCVCFTLFLCSHHRPLLAKTTISVSATINLEMSYLAFMDNRTPGQVSSFSSPYASRNVVSLVLMQKALLLGGMDDVEFEFHVVPNSERERTEVKCGRVVVGSQDYWDYDFDDTVYKSDPVITDGTFEKGMYTYPSNAPMLSVQNGKELKDRSAVIVGTWKGDVALLRSLEVKDVHAVYELQTIAKFLSLGRADFTLLEFSSKPDMSVSISGLPLVPVPGIKVVLPGNRCWMVSKKHPLGDQVFKALGIGLKRLQQEGTIRRALTESGFFQKRAKGWRVINREE
ncbi:hypothetical protein [Fundidesulfovibrio putealis]|uniref:hypothetical protein n=1 Tax=Fundidesulfovibrio putealis TaxID=270496 RepID=UPI0004841708|nr:hypothetical protein [Fundidesulfovibrio putealis]